MRRGVIERAQAGDREAFESLAAGRVDRLFGAAVLVLHDRTLAEDAVQETLIRVWRDLPHLRDPDRLDPWIYRVLVHTCLDVARHERPPLPVGELPGWLVSPEELEGDVVERDVIGRGMERLSPRDRTVLVLRFFMGLSVPEIAEAMRVPTGTAKSRLHNAERAMRAAVDADSRLTLQGGLV